MKTSAFQLISSDVSHHSHPAVSLQYLETICRYDKFLSNEPTLLANAVVSQLDQYGHCVHFEENGFVSGIVS